MPRASRSRFAVRLSSRRRAVPVQRSLHAAASATPRARALRSFCLLAATSRSVGGVTSGAVVNVMSGPALEPAAFEATMR